MSSDPGNDPALFYPEAIIADTVAFNETVTVSFATALAIHEQQPQVLRDERREAKQISLCIPVGCTGSAFSLDYGSVGRQIVGGIGRHEEEFRLRVRQGPILHDVGRPVLIAENSVHYMVTSNGSGAGRPAGVAGHDTNGSEGGWEAKPTAFPVPVRDS